MIPRSLSATSMQVAELCLARWKAEQFDRAPGISHSAASLGTAVHGALEMYVKTVYLEGGANPGLELLLDYFKISYMTTFGTADTQGEDYDDGVEMLKAWFKRTDFSTFKVISCENKTSFDIKTSAGPIPFNYIWDRFDELPDGTIRVVDYKTNRWGINPMDLKKKIQARAYGVAAQIMYPDAPRIKIEFDMLRHEGPVGIVFSKNDNIAMWRFMVATAERLIGTPEDEATETLNAECRFCVRKASCDALQRNLRVGGIMSFSDPKEAIDLRAALEWQSAGINSLKQDLDNLILQQAKAMDEFHFESDMNEMDITVSSRRSVDAERVEMVIGPRLFEKYGGKSFAVGALDKLLRSNEVTDEQKAQLRGLVWQKKGEPAVKIKSKNPIDEE